MRFSREETKSFEGNLLEAGYKKYIRCLSSNEDYAYFKGFERNEENKPSYQIAFRFWDWTRYPQTLDESFGVDVLVLVSNKGRTDMIISYPDTSIEEVERIAKEFYELCLRNKLD